MDLQGSKEVAEITPDVAKKYAHLGWSIIPIVYKNKIPPFKFKWEEYQKRIATDDEIDSWFKKYGKINLACVSGKVSKVFSIDVDSREAFEWLSVMFKDNPLGYSLAFKTGRGCQILYKWNDRVPIFNSSSLIHKGIDTRGEGGFFVLPPSIHTSGKQYSWLQPGSPLEFGIYELANLPDNIAKDIFSVFNKDSLMNNKWDIGSNVSDGSIGGIQGGLRNDHNDINNQSSNAKGWIKELSGGVGEGKRHESVIKLSGYLLRQPGFGVTRTIEFLSKWNSLNTPPLSSNELIKTISDINTRYVQDTLDRQEGDRQRKASNEVKSNLEDQLEAKNKKLSERADRRSSKLERLEQEKIDKAKKKQGVKREFQKIQDEAKAEKTRQSDLKKKEKNEEAFGILSEFISKITILKYPDKNNMFRIGLANGKNVDVKEPALYEWRLLTPKITKHIFRVIPHIARDPWLYSIDKFLSCSSTIEVNADETLISDILEIITSKIRIYNNYKNIELENNEEKTEKDIVTSESTLLIHCIQYKGEAFFKMSTFMGWIYNREELRRKSKFEIVSFIKAVGFVIGRFTIDLRSGGESKITIWKISSKALGFKE